MTKTKIGTYRGYPIECEVYDNAFSVTVSSWDSNLHQFAAYERDEHLFFRGNIEGRIQYLLERVKRTLDTYKENEIERKQTICDATKGLLDNR
jgi:hypothetical protein